MGELLRGVGLNLGVKISTDESCDGDEVSLVKLVKIAKWLMEGTNGMNVTEMVYGMYVLTLHKPMVFSYTLY